MGRNVGLYQCNICNWEGEEYFKRDDSLVCPRCNSRQRHRSIYRYLAEHNLLAGGTCLDVASRRIFRRKLKYSQYVNIDIVPGRADLVMDVCDLHFHDDSFDLIICCSVLQFVSNYETALDEMRRVLNHTGKCLIQVPCDHSIDQTYLKEPGSTARRCSSAFEVVVFSYADLLQRLRQRFQVETVIYQDSNIVFSQQEFFVCSKKL